MKSPDPDRQPTQEVPPVSRIRVPFSGVGVQGPQFLNSETLRP